MAAGNSTFIGDVLNQMGLINSLKNSDLRYPELTMDEIKNLNPNLIFLSSEPFPFKEIHINELKQLVPNATVKLVDGELFSWYGSRLLKSVEYLNNLEL
jgi:ABC-type Fe3+-hydroxamate transport system substrate-binding protein